MIVSESEAFAFLRHNCPKHLKITSPFKIDLTCSIFNILFNSFIFDALLMAGYGRIIA